MNKADQLEMNYYQKLNEKDLEIKTTFEKSRYLEEEIFISTNETEDHMTKVYITKNGKPIKTKVYDKKKNIKYIINYGKKIRITTVKNNSNEANYVSDSGYDVYMLAFLLSGYKPDKKNILQVNILEYKTATVNSVKLEILDTNADFIVSDKLIKTVKFKITTFFVYETILIYGKNHFPALLYYKGPTSINFLNKTIIKIIPESYIKADKFFK